MCGSASFLLWSSFFEPRDRCWRIGTACIYGMASAVATEGQVGSVGHFPAGNLVRFSLHLFDRILLIRKLVPA